VIGLRTPALRDRAEDLTELAHALLHRMCDEAGHAAPALSNAALRWLQARELPGNARELENLLQRALALSSGGMPQPSDFGDGDGSEDDFGDTAPDTLPAELDAPPSDGTPRFIPLPGHDAGEEPALPADLQTYLDDQERRVLEQALQASGYNRTAAAARLGLNLRQIRYRIQRLGIVMPGTTAAGDGDGDPPDG